MYQKIIVPIDHGNRNLKTEQHVFTSGILESDCKPVCVIFIGGGALLLREYLENSDKVGKCVFIEDICVNAKGYGLLYQVQKKGR